MAQRQKESRGLRLDPELWAIIDSEAESVGFESTTAFLRLRLGKLFGYAPERHKVPRNGDNIAWGDPSDDQE